MCYIVMAMDPQETCEEQLTFLRARDPSIVSYNRSKYQKVRRNLVPFMEETKVQSGDHFMKIYLRLKGDVSVSPLYKVENNIFCCEVPPSHHKQHLKEGDVLHKNYTFSEIFESDALQMDIFNTIIKPKIFDLINGRNSACLAYGASGSGKTYTIVGTESEPGVIPRALEYLFRSLPPLGSMPNIESMEGGAIKHLEYTDQIHAQNTMDMLITYFNKVCDAQGHKETYKKMQQRLSEQATATVDYEMSDVSLAVWISFAEIYNETIFDLLQPQTKNRTKLKLHYRKNGDPYIKGLTSIYVSTGLEAYQYLSYGLTNLNYAATALNEHSSRSHSIFTIQLVQCRGQSNHGCISTFNFCDLAGSERLKKTNNVGDRLKESNNINTSLLVLGRCLKEVRDSQKRKDKRTIPFRDSQLTKLFQHAISGRDNLSMIINVNPSEYMYPETQHVLNFSAVAMEVKIENKPKVLLKTNSVEDAYAQERIMELEDLVDHMQEQLDRSEDERDKLISKYMDMIRVRSIETERRWEERLQEQKNMYEKERNVLYARWREAACSMKVESKDSVIEISDSDDEAVDVHFKCRSEISSLKETANELERKLKESETKILSAKRMSNRRLERVIELEHEIYLNDTYNSSVHLNADGSDSEDSVDHFESKDSAHIIGEVS